MEVRIYNSDLYRVGQIENQTSLIWTRRYYEPGEFELHAPITTENLQLLTEGNLVSMKGAAEAGVIEDIEKEESDVKNEITAKGRFLSSYMDRRLIKQIYTVSNGKIEESMHNLIDVCDTIPLLTRAALKGYSDTITFQISYKGLQVVETKLAKAGTIGYRFRPDFENKKIIFETYKGADHTTTQNTNSRVIFSEDYNNLKNAIYKYNDQKLKTRAVVGGEGEGTARKYITVGSGSGLNLREVFVDARDISSADMTTAEYEAALQQRGYDALNEDIVAESLECETEPSINFIYKTDYDLGDVVTVKKRKWGLFMNQRITELQEVYEHGTGYVVPTLGSPLSETIDWGDN